MMTAENVTPIIEPDAEQMRQHLEHLFGGDLGGHHLGLIEIAWTHHEAAPDGRHPLCHARLFGTDEIDEAVEEALRQNRVPNQNVYVGAALRRPGSRGRCYDADFLALPAFYADLDEAHATLAARSRYSACPPTMIIITGRHPEPRAQLWWRLDEPETDADRCRLQNHGLAVALSGDTSVVNPGRVMRLGGSIAWPVKAGRQIERTEVTFPAQRGAAAYPAAVIAAAFPPSSAALAAKGDVPAEEYRAETGGMGLDSRIQDGRERYMRDTLAACLIEWIGEYGAAPTAEELLEAAWPQYERNVDLSRAGRGKAEMAAKARYTVRRFEQGRIRGARTLKEAAASYQAKTYRRPDPSIVAPLPDTAGLPLVWFRDIREVDTSVTDFVEGLLCDRQMSVVYGESNCGKTFFMTNLGMHVALGWPWHGRAVDAGGVVYCALEGGHGIRNRLLAFGLRHNITANDLPFAIVPSAIDLLRPQADTEKLIAAIQTAAGALTLPMRLVVIDTLSRAMAGGNENAPDDMGALVMNADRIRQATGAHICFIHHSGKDTAKGARGHSLLRAATDTEIEIVRDAISGLATATATKQRELEIDGQFGFTLEKIELGRNRRDKPITSCVVIPAEPIIGRPRRLSTKERRAVEVLHNLLIETGQPAPQCRHIPQTTVAKLSDFRTWLQRTGVTSTENAETERRQFNRLCQDLDAKGVIRIWDEWIWTPGQ